MVCNRNLNCIEFVPVQEHVAMLGTILIVTVAIVLPVLAGFWLKPR